MSSLNRACAACEQELGILDRTDSSKSHGQCKRHFLIFLKAGGFSDADISAAVARMDAIPLSYCPDLSIKVSPPAADIQVSL